MLASGKTIEGKDKEQCILVVGKSIMWVGGKMMNITDMEHNTI